MRRKPLLLIGLGAILLVPAHGLTQFPGGSGSGDSRGKYGGGSGSGSDYRSRFMSRPGSGGPTAPMPGSAAPGTPGSSGPGGSFGGSSRGPSESGGSSSGSNPLALIMGGGPGGMPDPNQLFYTFSQGREVLRREEMPPMLQPMFDRAAQQLNITNGQLTKQQFDTLMQGVMMMRQSMQSPEGQARFGEDMFRRQDRNGDGLLNFDEMSDALKDERDKWDMNRDGFIDLNEYVPYFQGRMQQRMQERTDPSGWGGGGYVPPAPPDSPPPEEDAKPVIHRAGKLPKELPSWFSQMDADGDAQVGMYEWKSSGRSFDEFKTFDRNDDGFLTVAEVLRANGQAGSSSTTVANSGGGNRPSGSGLGNIFSMFGRGSSGGSSSGGSSRGGSGRPPGR